jgi:hypothetical protein
MSAKTAEEAFNELKKEGLLENEQLAIKTHVSMGGIGTLRADIEHGHNNLFANGAAEKRYLEIVEHLTREDIFTLDELLKDYYSKTA